MYPDVQNEPLPSEYQTKQRTIQIKLTVESLLYHLLNENDIPVIVENCLEQHYFDIDACEEITSIVLNMQIDQSRETLKKMLVRYLDWAFDDLFAWSDESNSYYEKG